MNILIIVLRLLHILAGVFWVGAAILNTFFLAPTMVATAEAGQKFVAHLVSKARLSARVTVASYITVIAGSILYWIDSQGLTSPWQRSGPGIGFGLGAVAAFVGFGFGQMLGKHVTIMAKLAAQIPVLPRLSRQPPSTRRVRK